MCFGGSSPPAPTPAPAPPTRDDASVKAAQAAEDARMRKMRGRQASILTSSQGDTEEANTKTKSLLGS